MGQISTARIITRPEIAGKASHIQPGNREWVTIIKCISAVGKMVPDCIIFKGKVHLESWYETPGLNQDWLIELSENGWTTHETGLLWLQNTFIPFATKYRRGNYTLLVIDGHGSLCTAQFDHICKENNIITICMPPHSSHILQPLDVSCFKPLKQAYGDFIRKRGMLGVSHVDRPP